MPEKRIPDTRLKKINTKTAVVQACPFQKSYLRHLSRHAHRLYILCPISPDFGSSELTALVLSACWKGLQACLRMPDAYLAKDRTDRHESRVVQVRLFQKRYDIRRWYFLRRAWKARDCPRRPREIVFLFFFVWIRIMTRYYSVVLNYWKKIALCS